MSSDDEPLPQELSDVGSEDEEEDEEDEEEDEEEDDEPRKRRKTNNNKQPLGVEYFFDDQAEDADDSEDDEIEAEEGYEEIAAEIHDSQARSSRIYNKSRVLDDRDEDDRLQEYAKRFQQYNSDEEGDEDDIEEDSNISMRRNLPTPNGPKLWKIKCKQGKERRAVLRILERCFDRESEGQQTQILSVFSCDHLKGCVYVEARKPVHVKNILNGIRIFPQNVKLVLVPLPEMPEVLKAGKEQVTVHKDTWVRIKRGQYKNDIAKVVEVLESQSKVIVKLIPRLDLTNLDDVNQSKRKRNQRMPPRFFNYEEVRAIVGPQVQTKRDKNGSLYYIFNKDKFKNGFVYKTVNIKSLNTVNVQPTFEENQKFLEHDEDGEETFVAPLPVRSAKKDIHFTKGDVVMVMEGELKTMRGVVESVKGTCVEVRPTFDGYDDTETSILPFESHELRKCFMDGDHVKVIAGVHKGETGMIVKVEDNVVMIFSDVTNKVLQVLSSDIQDCSDVNPTRFSIGEFELHDMVALTTSTATATGVIVKIDKDTCQVMETNGNIKSIGVQEIRFKRKDGETYDKTSASLKVNDIVMVLDGKYKGKQGTIKHVFRTHVYIYSRGVFENSGIFVVKSTACRKLEGNLGGNRPKTSIGTNTPLGLMSPSHHGVQNQQREMQKNTVIPRFRKVKDPLLHQTVKIMRGPWKGYIGMVVDVTSNQYRVELHTKNKTVNVNKDEVRHVESRSVISQNEFTSMQGNATPMHIGTRTPMHGDRTPMHGDRTPMHGDRTPIRGDRTPSRGDRTPSRNDDYDHVGTPNYQPQLSPYSPFTPSVDPGYQMNYSVDTPSYTATPRSLESPYSSITPQSYPVTPSISMNPQTPGTPSVEYYGIHEDTGLSTDIEVKINDGFHNGQYRGVQAVIRDMKNIDSCIVELLNSRKRVPIPSIYLEPVNPIQSDRVKIIKGEYQGHHGNLKQIDQAESSVVIQLDDGNITMIPSSHVAKYIPAVQK